MNSKIEKELSDAADVTAKRGEDRQDYLARLMKAVASLSDKAWEKLSEAAQDWFNDNAEARNKAKKAGKSEPDVEEFADLEEEEEEKPKTRSRAKDSDDGDEKPAKVEKITGGPKDIKKGMTGVTIENKRGKTFEGDVVDMDDEVVVIKQGDGEEIEIDLDRIVKVSWTEVPAGKGKASAKEEDADPIKVGAAVTVITKRGKELTGTIKEITDEDLVLTTDDGEEELSRSRIETITPTKAAKGKTEAKEEKPAAKGKGKEEAEEPAKAKRAVNPEGVSIGQRIKELIADNQDEDEAGIGKLLKKEGIEFKENTLKLNYVDCHKFLAVLKEKGLLAKAKK
jgi:ribosome maturation factor RimP